MEYGLSSRNMALVAVVEREGDQAGNLPKTMVVPVGMAQDVEFGSYFGRARSCISPKPSMAGEFENLLQQFLKPSSSQRSMDRSVHYCIESSFCAIPDSLQHLEAEHFSQNGFKINLAVELAAMIEPDGGMPGDTIEDRILASVIVLLYFKKEGNTLGVGTFRIHVKKLVDFLRNSVGKCPEEYNGYILQFLDTLEKIDCSRNDFMSHLLNIKKNVLSLPF